jgi:hypothetical protein
VKSLLDLNLIDYIILNIYDDSTNTHTRARTINKKKKEQPYKDREE